MANQELIAVKVCCNCKKEKPVSDFNVKDKVTGKLQSRCKPCQAEVSRAHYLANKQKTIARSAANGAERRVKLEQIVRSRLAAACCAHCGVAENLTFHANRDYAGPRVSAILNSGMALEALLDSIEHSTVLCKPCEAKTFYKSLEAYQNARRQDAGYAPNRTPKNEYKSRYIKANKDRRFKAQAA